MDGAGFYVQELRRLQAALEIEGAPVFVGDSADLTPLRATDPGCGPQSRLATIPRVDPAAIVQARFPEAVGSLLTGSSARGCSTASSDLDIIVLLAGRPAPMRRTDRIENQLVEFFVHTEDSFCEFADRERVRRRSPLVHMAAHSRIIDDVDGTATRVRDIGRELWDAGPQAMTHSEIEDRRYRLTAMLDDLAEETEPAESAALAATVVLDVADLALVSRGCWSGGGRWLMRRLRAVDSELARDLAAGLHATTAGDPTPLVHCGMSELRRVGGPLDADYERRA